MLLSTIGGVGMWSVVVALPAIQTEFGVDRADASLPYTLTMLGFGFGGVLMGRLADRFGIAIPLALGTLSLGLGYLAVGHADSLWQVAIAQGLLIGGGCSVTFGPLMADISHWFMRRRGIAVALAASGNYLAGTIWPPVVQHFIAAAGWRATHIGIGLFLIVGHAAADLACCGGGSRPTTPTPPAPRPRAGRPSCRSRRSRCKCCCASPALPAAWRCRCRRCIIVAYCGDLGYGVARGADMLSLMLGLRHRQPDRLGLHRRPHRRRAHAAARLGAARRGAVALSAVRRPVLALRDLGAVRPVPGRHRAELRHHRARIFPAKQASTRVGLVIMATLVGMALGGWMSGAIFDLTGSYQAAFLNGIAWNLLNVTIMTFLLLRSRRRPRLVAA